ncbi:MAG TPA: hypothetical protein VG796_21325 [Verrucomicrobiales bacterium]|nr:hypothetical protein [Verrucomicrobiales bacterium]
MNTKFHPARRLASLLLLAASIPAARGGDVPDLAALDTAIANNDPAIRITGDITLPASRTINASLDFKPPFKLFKGATSLDLIINGAMPNRPEHFFGKKAGTFEWEPGDIRGMMGKTSTTPGSDRLAEWWGALSSAGLIFHSNPAIQLQLRQADDDTRAINCAVGAVPVNSAAATPTEPYTVQLGSGLYYISCPVILTNTKCTLRGRSSFNTGLIAFTNPDVPAEWQWLAHTSGFTWMKRLNPGDGNTAFQNTSNHVAMIYVGGTVFQTPAPPLPLYPAHFQKKRNPDPAAALTKVYDIGFGPMKEFPDDPTQTNCPAYYWPDPSFTPGNAAMSHVSCLHGPDAVSSLVGPGTLLQNINGGNYTAYGVGFCESTVVDGFTFHGFHMNNMGAKSTAPGHGIFLPSQTSNCTIEKGTIGAGYHMFWPGAPDDPCNPNDRGLLDMIAIVAQGTNVKISNIHIEHCHVGVDIISSLQGSPPTDVFVTNVDYNVDTSAPSYQNYSPHAALVRIRGRGREDEAPNDLQVNATIRNTAIAKPHLSFPHLSEPGSSFSVVPSLLQNQPAFPTMAYYKRGSNADPRSPLF